MPNDLYQILGIERSASQDEIKRAFRKLAHQYHPDKKGGNEQKFKEINAAYQVLGDEKKRAQYDQFGSAAFEGGAGGQGFGGFGAQGINFDFGDLGDLGDIFGSMFGGGRAQSRRTSHGQDIEVDVTIDFKEMAFGATRTVNLHKLEDCGACKGSGSKSGKTKKCATCGGSGVERVARRTPLGVMQSTTTCGSCHGSGSVPEDVCGICSGTGVHKQPTHIEVAIPAGIDEGQVLRVRGRGEAAPYGGQTGDLYLRISVKSHRTLARDGETVRSSVTIGFTQAALGDTVDVQTVDGIVEVDIPSGTQSGDELRLRGKGIRFSPKPGDHIVTVRVETPRKLSRAQKKLLEELDHRV